MISSSYNNLDFVGTLLFLRAALQVAMATMHFHITQIGSFLGKDFCIQVVPGNNLAPIKIVLGCKVGEIRYQGI